VAIAAGITAATVHGDRAATAPARGAPDGFLAAMGFGMLASVSAAATVAALAIAQAAAWRLARGRSVS
jgi:hypothetical protein